MFSSGFAASLQVDPQIQIIGFDELRLGVQAYTAAKHPRTTAGGQEMAADLASVGGRRGSNRKRKRKSSNTVDGQPTATTQLCRRRLGTTSSRANTT